MPSSCRPPCTAAEAAFSAVVRSSTMRAKGDRSSFDFVRNPIYLEDDVDPRAHEELAAMATYLLPALLPRVKLADPQ